MDQKKILIVEDDEFLREIYIDTLKKANFLVDFAVDGEEAYTKITTTDWDLLLQDIVLPKANGIEIIQKIKDEGKYQFTKPIIFLTNLDNNEEMSKATSLGNGYLIKSQLTPGDLLNQVQMFLQKS